MTSTFQTYAKLYRETLFENVIPFWMSHSPDREFGGYFTCLDRQGQIYDTDKFVWLQGREVWTFAMLYNRVEQKQEWLEFAKLGAEFLRKHAMDAQGDCYFSLDRQGQPLIQPYNIFSDCFVSLAFYQYSLASGDSAYHTLAQQCFARILSRRENPKGIYEKSTGSRPMKGFALPMILANLCLEMPDLLPEKQGQELIDRCIHTVMEVFYDPDTGLIHEHVHTDGSLLDNFEGRLINPGHGIEAMWFMMDLAQKRGNQGLLDQAVTRCLGLLQFGWDRDHGGIFYFMDAKNAPPLSLEWDQKLWWVHLEALIALAKAYLYTGRSDVWEWYQRIDGYTWSHFPDLNHGEWFGYLNRQGQPLLSLKGGKWKGCYHVPRALYECWQVFDALEKG